MVPRVITQSESCEPIPDFISVLRAIRDTFYPQISIWHTECQEMYTECTEVIKPDIDNKWLEMTNIYNAMLVISAQATTVEFDQPATALYDPNTGLMSFDIPRGEPGYGLQFEGQDTIENILLITPDTQGETWQSTNAGFMSDGTTPVAIDDIIICTGTEWVNAGPMRGPQGEQGNQGIAGANGEKWFVGTLDPVTGEGDDGDLGLNTSSYDIFEKQVGTWNNIGNIKGAQGEKGDAGRTTEIWNNIVIYDLGQMATYSGKAYVALTQNQNTTPVGNPLTWRVSENVINNTLVSNSTSQSLSANQGRALNESKIGAENFATSTTGGTVKMRLASGVLYLRNDGQNA